MNTFKKKRLMIQHSTLQKQKHQVLGPNYYIFIATVPYCIHISDDVMSRQNSIEQIKQEGFVFKVFKQKDYETAEGDNTSIPKLNSEIINGLEVEESTFLISNRDRLLHGRVLVV